MADIMREEGRAYTYADYCALPEDGSRYELLEGDLEVTPAPNLRHQKISRELTFVLLGHIKAADLGELFAAPVDVIFDEKTILQPDIIFVARERCAILSERGVEGPPDLVVEILSSTTSRKDRILKMRLYAKHGVKWYWLVDPDARTLEELNLVREHYSLTGACQSGESFTPGIFPGLAIDLRELFA
jgi:Uma2 family endonuclease